MLMNDLNFLVSFLDRFSKLKIIMEIQSLSPVFLRVNFRLHYTTYNDAHNHHDLVKFKIKFIIF